ncbi:MAG: MurR/RpiR family transcriptional regulator [Clostridiales bacterium]|nr:MurR/RpiR family transcriptional regulator [Clostridiales bacterium]
MESTLFKIKSLFDKMSNSDKKIANFLLESPQSIIPLSISELADKCKCSEATIVRFAKKLDFDGYQQLKISIAQENNVSSLNEKISVDDDVFDVFTKVCNEIYFSLNKTKTIINKEHLEEFSKAIINAKNIYLFGLGNSAAIALDAAHKFLRLGLKANAYTDNHMQVIVASHATNKDLVIGISHSGSSKDIVEALKIAKKNQATTVCITNFGKSPITKVSDIIINTCSDETSHSILGLNSRIAQLAIIDAIYSYLTYHLPNITDAISNTESALIGKKF